MSIVSILQDYLTEYDDMAIRPLKDVLTDETDIYPDSYTLAPVGNSLLESDCLGNETHQNSYVFYAKSNSINEIDRKENHDFLEDFTNWIKNRNRKGDYPDLGDSYTVIELSVSNTMLFGVDSEGVSLYQVQIQLIYERKSDLWQ